MPITRPLLLVVLLASLALCAACTGRSSPQEVKHLEDDIDAEQQIRQETRYISSVPGMKPDTLWRLQAQYLDAHGKPLSTFKFEVMLSPGEWNSELAPLDVSSGWAAFRYPGQFGDGVLDLAEAMRLAPKPLPMRLGQTIIPLETTERVPVPSGAVSLQARLLQMCPVQVRRMRQFNYRAAGDVIALRRVKEEMRWREYRISGPCREFAGAGK